MCGPIWGAPSRRGRSRLRGNDGRSQCSPPPGTGKCVPFPRVPVGHPWLLLYAPSGDRKGAIRRKIRANREIGDPRGCQLSPGAQVAPGIAPVFEAALRLGSRVGLGGEVQLRVQARSQMQFGNEGTTEEARSQIQFGNEREETPPRPSAYQQEGEDGVDTKKRGGMPRLLCGATWRQEQTRHSAVFLRCVHLA